MTNYYTLTQINLKINAVNNVIFIRQKDELNEKYNYFYDMTLTTYWVITPLAVEDDGGDHWSWRQVVLRNLLARLRGGPGTPSCVSAVSAAVVLPQPPLVKACDCA